MSDFCGNCYFVSECSEADLQRVPERLKANNPMRCANGGLVFKKQKATDCAFFVSRKRVKKG